MQGITEFTFWGYEHAEKLKITQVPYRDINVAPTDLGEGRIQIVMSSFAIVQPQWQAVRHRQMASSQALPRQQQDPGAVLPKHRRDETP